MAHLRTLTVMANGDAAVKENEHLATARPPPPSGQIFRVLRRLTNGIGIYLFLLLELREESCEQTNDFLPRTLR